jgi:hypothetical protein
VFTVMDCSVAEGRMSRRPPPLYGAVDEAAPIIKYVGVVPRVIDAFDVGELPFAEKVSVVVAFHPAYETAALFLPATAVLV